MSVKHIFRVQRNKDFVTINKTCLDDDRLSLRAKGLHNLMCAQKDDWVFYLDDLCKRSKDGKDSTKAALKELQQFGYVRKYAERDEKGRIVRWVTDVFEYPQPVLATSGKPVNIRVLSRSGFTTSGQATCGKPAPNKNNSNNKNNFNKNNIVTGQDVSVDNLENENNAIENKLARMIKSGIIGNEDRARLKPELMYHVTHRPASMTVEHAVNAACRLIKDGKWSTPKGMMKQAQKDWETKYENDKIRERQECVNSELGQLMASIFKSKL